MTYEVRFVNGIWTLFDTDQYASVHVYDLERTAREDCDRVNKELTQR